MTNTVKRVWREVHQGANLRVWSMGVTVVAYVICLMRYTQSSVHIYIYISTLLVHELMYIFIYVYRYAVSSCFSISVAFTAFFFRIPIQTRFANLDLWYLWFMVIVSIFPMAPSVKTKGLRCRWIQCWSAGWLSISVLRRSLVQKADAASAFVVLWF